eukprot:4204993-Prymnesium_polylepis.1
MAQREVRALACPHAGEARGARSFDPPPASVPQGTASGARGGARSRSTLGTELGELGTRWARGRCAAVRNQFSNP